MNGQIVRVIPSWVLERWILVAYLIINWDMKKLGDMVKAKPQKDFFEVVAQHMTAYLKDGTMPPADIAPAILNLADDHLAGRPISLRAGDYIAIQNHIRQSR